MHILKFKDFLYEFRIYDNQVFDKPIIQDAQRMLIQLEFMPPFAKVDGVVGPITSSALADFQAQNGIKDSNGIIDAKTVKKLKFLTKDETKFGFDFEFGAVPNSMPKRGTEWTAENFGRIYLVERVPDPRNLAVRLVEYEEDKLIKKKFDIPELGKKFGNSVRYQTIHEKVGHQFQGFFRDIANAGFLDDILTFNGLNNVRFRVGTPMNRRCPGCVSYLSNHTWATAIDLNTQWNGFKQTPAKPNELGCLYRIVPIAKHWGFNWGGNWKKTKDGMHFEIAEILPLSHRSFKPVNRTLFALG